MFSASWWWPLIGQNLPILNPGSIVIMTSSGHNDSMSHWNCYHVFQVQTTFKHKYVYKSDNIHIDEFWIKLQVSLATQHMSTHMCTVYIVYTLNISHLATVYVRIWHISSLEFCSQFSVHLHKTWKNRILIWHPSILRTLAFLYLCWIFKRLLHMMRF